MQNALRVAVASLALIPTIASAHPGYEGAGLAHGFLGIVAAAF